MSNLLAFCLETFEQPARVGIVVNKRGCKCVESARLSAPNRCNNCTCTCKLILARENTPVGKQDIVTHAFACNFNQQIQKTVQRADGQINEQMRV